MLFKASKEYLLYDKIINTTYDKIINSLL